jgi:hypothetical protein
VSSGSLILLVSIKDGDLNISYEEVLDVTKTFDGKATKLPADFSKAIRTFKIVVTATDLQVIVADKVIKKYTPV